MDELFFERREEALGHRVVIALTSGSHRPGDTGQGLCVKRGQIHSFRNDAGSEVRFLCVAAPGVFGRPYFEDLADAFASFGDGPPNPAVIGDVMRDGLTPVGPS